ncbi:ankyrin repeat domain-containing protein [Wolbachia endosymbiont of Folsomia candida]|uniref:ankyrin repeat domain-containing protein n=1 Tax=Wolbachia endosymbiont of Folsomia candida TaxID=169402 RepID=UPI000A795205|nr:ankyrin repeat domain-containing protein [Wolbachia endosymbiont of Folsomia candida]APR98408.1 hypothetical protein ASM33_03935 [Wolbachia endosymbiont of Folsomia candida]
MHTTEPPDKEQELYDDLEKAIKSGTADDILHIIDKQDIVDLDHVFNAKNPKLYDLLNYTTDNDREIAGAIFKTLQRFYAEGNFTHHLSDKIYDAIVSNQPSQENVVEGILEFASINKIDRILLSSPGNKFKHAILHNRDHTNEMFNFAKKKNKQDSFLYALNNILYDAIVKKQKDAIVSIFNFASTNNLLNHDQLYGFTNNALLKFAKEKGLTEIVKAINAAKDTLEPEAQHKPSRAADSQAAPEAEAEPTPITPPLPPQSWQGESHKKGTMPTDEDLQNLADRLLTAITNDTSVESILTSNSIQHVLIRYGVNDNAENFCTFLVYAIHYDRENVAIEILNTANPETLAFLLEKKQEVMLDGNPVDYTALNYAIKKGHEKLVKIIEAKNAELEAQTQHKPPKAADGQAAPPQSGQGESDEEEKMVTNTEVKLTSEQQKLYTNLKAAIKSGDADSVYTVLDGQDRADLLRIFDAESKELYDLLNYTKDDGRAVAEKIFDKFIIEGISGNFINHLSDKIVSDNEDVAEGISKFAKTNIMYSTIFDNLSNRFKHVILHNQDHASKIFNFGKKGPPQIPKLFLLDLYSILRYAINNGQKDNVVNIFNFARNHNVLEDVLNHRYKEGTITISDLAQQQKQTEIVTIIEAAEAKLKSEDQHKPPKAPDGLASTPQSGQGESHKEGDMSPDEDLQNLTSKLFYAIKDNENIENILARDDIQDVLRHGRATHTTTKKSQTLLIYAIDCDRENVAINILNRADSDTLTFLLGTKPMVTPNGEPAHENYTVLNYATEKGHEKLVKIIEAAKDTLEPEAQHKPPKAPDGLASTPQSGQGESHKEGDMVTTTEALKQEQQKLYDGLKTAIENDRLTLVFKVLSTQTHQDLLDVFNAEDQKLYDLLNYTTHTGKEIAGAIFKRFQQVGIEKNFQSHLSDKVYDAIVSKQEDVAEGILEFAKTNNMYSRLFYKLGNEFIDSILNNNQDQGNANKIFNFAKKGNHQEFFMSDLYNILYDAIHENQKDHVANILNFAGNHNVLEDVLSYNYQEGTPLKFAEVTNLTEIVKIIEAKIAQFKAKTQHKQPKAADGQAAPEVKPISTPTTPPQSGQGESHKEGDMVTTTEALKQEQQKLYDDLEKAIKSGTADGVSNVLHRKGRTDLLRVFNAESNGLYNLLNYTTPEDQKIAEKILEASASVGMRESFASHLFDKMYDSVVSNQSNKENVAEGILEFAKMNNIYSTLFSYLTHQFKYNVVNNQGHANEIFNFAQKKNEQNRFLRALNDILYDTLINREKNKEIKDDIVSIFNFASTNSLLNHANRHILHGFRGDTLLQFAQQEGLTEIVTIIDAQNAEFQAPEPLTAENKPAFPGLTSDRSFPFPMSGLGGISGMSGYNSPSHGGWDSSNETPTFFSKHGEKIAFGTIGLLLVIGGAVLCGFGQLALGISLLIMGVVLAGALVMKAEKSQEMWHKASDKLSDLFVSKQEPNPRNL